MIAAGPGINGRELRRRVRGRPLAEGNRARWTKVRAIAVEIARKATRKNTAGEPTEAEEERLKEPERKPKASLKSIGQRESCRWKAGEIAKPTRLSPVGPSSTNINTSVVQLYTLRDFLHLKKRETPNAGRAI